MFRLLREEAFRSNTFRLEFRLSAKFNELLLQHRVVSTSITYHSSTLI
jgi:hypothetical protein